MAHLIWQVTVDALGMSMIYVLLAVGLNLIITTTRIVLVAYGNFYMIGAYAVWFFSVSLKIPYFISLAIAGLITAALGVVVYFAIFRHTQRREQRFLSDLTAALGLMMILGQVAVLFFGSAPKSIPPAFPGKLSVIGATITYERLIVILLGIAMTVVLALFLQRTNLGRALRTVAVNTDIAALLGVNWNRVYLVTMAVGCALAAWPVA